MIKRITAMVILLGLLAGLALPASATTVATVDPKVYAGTNYSAVVSNATLSFQKNGHTTAVYDMRNSNLVLLTDQADDLMVCFHNKKDQFVGVSLGKQPSLSVSGAVDILTLGDELDREVTIDSFCKVNRLDVNASVGVTVNGVVDTLYINSDATVTATGASVVGQVNITDLGADFNQNSGASVGYTDNTAAVSSSKGIRLYCDPIYAFHGDELGDIAWELEDNVRAYRNGKKISGEAEWAVSESKELRKDGSYRFRFVPDDESTEKIYGTIRVIVVDEETDEDFDMEIDEIIVTTTTKRLSDLTSKLKKSVTVRDEDGRKISGTCIWSSENQRVRETDFFDFIFIPNSSKYDSIRGEIEIIVEED